MSLLRHRSATHSVMALERDPPPRAEHVRVVPSPAVDDGPTQVLAQGATDPVEDLLVAVANGDDTALAALERHVEGLVRLNIRRIVRDASRSDAVTQEFFAGMLQDLTSFDPDRDSAQSWLLTHAHQRALSELGSAHAESS